MALAAAGIAVNYFGGSSNAGPAGASVIPAEASPTHSGAPVNGIDPADPVGTCYASPTPDGDRTLGLSVIGCGSPHIFELVTVARAADSATYPPDSYWNGPVADACDQDLVNYTGESLADRPAGLDSVEFIPEPGSWPTGDRTIYCMAKTVPARLGSVKKGRH